MKIIKYIKDFINTKILKLYFIKKTPFFCHYRLRWIRNNYLLCVNCPYCKGYNLKNGYIKLIKGTKGYRTNRKKWKKGKFYKREVWRLYSTKCNYEINN